MWIRKVESPYRTRILAALDHLGYRVDTPEAEIFIERHNSQLFMLSLTSHFVGQQMRVIREELSRESQAQKQAKKEEVRQRRNAKAAGRRASVRTAQVVSAAAAASQSDQLSPGYP